MAAPRRRMLRIASASEQVAKSLRLEIRGGQWLPGAQLPVEVELAEEMGVSRGTLRLALRLLSAEGLVESRRGSGAGTFVRCSTECHVTIEGLLESRRLLEVPAARRAATRPTTEADLAVVLESDLVGFERNRAFHEALLNLSGDPLLSCMAEPLFDWTRNYVKRLGSPEREARTAAEHAAIAEAISAGDPEAAAQAMDAHLRSVEHWYRHNGRDAAG